MIYKRKCKYCGKEFETEVHNKVFCCEEHQYLYRKDKQTPVLTKKCKYCGKEFETRQNRQNFCCAEHRKQYGLDKLNRERVKAKKHTQICIYCGAEYETFNNHQKYCCIEHKQAHYSEIHKVKEKKEKYDYNEKPCKRCGNMFKPNSGRQEYCEECRIIVERERGHKQYRKHHEARLKSAKERRDNRTEDQIQQDKEYQKQYRADNSDYLRQQCKQYRAEHKEEIAIRSKQYNEDHKEELKLKRREHYVANADELKAWQKAYRDNPENKDKIRESRRIYERKRRKDPVYKMRQTCRGMIRRCINKEKGWKRAVDILGYTPEQLVKHLESQFLSDMTWQNHGTVWHIDHIKPLAVFNFFNEDGSVNWDVVREANSLKNLRPLYVNENLLKSDNWTEEDEEAWLLIEDYLFDLPL